MRANYLSHFVFDRLQHLTAESGCASVNFHPYRKNAVQKREAPALRECNTPRTE